MNILFCDINPIPVKSALSIIGFESEGYRPPLFPLSKENYEKIRLELSELGLHKMPGR